MEFCSNFYEGPSFLHLFFAEDLMLKADWCNCGSVKEVCNCADWVDI